MTPQQQPVKTVATPAGQKIVEQPDPPFQSGDGAPLSPEEPHILVGTD